MNKLAATLTCFFLLTKFSADGQNTNNYWYFGINAEVFFDSSGAHTTTGNVNAAEGTASISDGCGLVFFTDGDTVWNKNHQMMVNGFDIGGKCAAFTASSSTQAVLIVRQPASDSIFYIFTTDCIEDNLVDGLRYSIVNINFNNGFGEVILKKQLLFTPAEEKVTAAKHANGCDIWIVSHEYGTNNFYSYVLSSSGLNTTPVISSSGQIHDGPNPYIINARGYLKASPNGQKLISVSPDGAYSFADTTLPELFSFDKLNGVVTSDFIFPKDTDYWWSGYSSWTIPFYGASFSPDNSKLYLSSGFYGPNLYQFDLNAGSAASIIASKFFLAYPYPFSASLDFPASLVNAPDGKMYVAQTWKGYLGVINNPDSTGLACNYVDSAFNLANGTLVAWGGLPNFFEDYINPKLLKSNFSYYQSATGDTIFFTNSSMAANTFVWYFGDGTTSTLQNPFHVYTDTGYHTVSLFAKDSLCDVDRICQTIYISPTFNPATLFAAANSSLCEKFCTDFSDQSTNNPTAWQWQFPGGDPSFSTLQNPASICYHSPGVFDVTLVITNANGNDTLTLNNYITVNPTPPIPTITQVGYTLTSTPATSYQWQLNTVNIAGATNQSYTVLQSALYTVIVDDANGCVNSANKDVLITGIEEMNSDAAIFISPNPSNGDFTVEFVYAKVSVNGMVNSGSDYVSIDVVNTLGQKIFSRQTRISGTADFKNEIDLVSAAPGVYFVEIKSRNIFLKRKIIITS